MDLMKYESKKTRINTGRETAFYVFGLHYVFRYKHLLIYKWCCIFI